MRGAALVTTLLLMGLLSVAAVSYVDSATYTVRQATRQGVETQGTHLCESGIQAVLRSLWRPFKISQNFLTMDAACSSASPGDPKASISGTIEGVGKFSAGVINITQVDSFTRQVTVRSVGWIDRNGNGVVDSGEPRKVVDVVATYQLSRSQVFDYTYFVNNYGWMDGFGPNDLVVNGDMRANGNFDFTNGSPTVNGSVYACLNEKLSPASAGLVNTPPVKWDNASYISAAAANGGSANDDEKRRRQGYTAGTHGAKGTSQFENWRDVIFDSDASIVNNHVEGAVVADVGGTKSWSRTNSGTSGTTSMLDATPTQEVIMPDLSDITYYQAASASYSDPKATFADGTANANYHVGAFVDVWDQTLNSGAGAYSRITTNGVVTGSALLVGTDAHPIKIHGPVTFTQDALIKGTVAGQGTLYTGRNTHIIGSIRYQTKPSFRGTDETTIDKANEKADMLGIAARGSVIMGDTTGFSDSYPLQYMTPPFTKGRYDENGNWIPPYDAKAVDSTGIMKYKSVMGDTLMHAVAEGINQIDAVLYTNFVGGGNIGTGGGGVIMNGSIISKDEAMVTWSLPLKMNYDTRIKERTLTSAPLIDLQLPRSPVMLRSSWQDRGFSYGY